MFQSLLLLIIILYYYTLVQTINVHVGFTDYIIHFHYINNYNITIVIIRKLLVYKVVFIYNNDTYKF